MRYAALALALTFAASLAASAEETYKVKLAEFLAKGKSVKVNETEALKQDVKMTDDKGNVVNTNNTTKVKTETFTEKTLEVADGKRSKYVRTYQKAVQKVGDKEAKMPVDGRTLNFDKVEGKFKVTAKGDPELPKATLTELTTNANRDNSDMIKAMLPKDAVKVGQTWKVPAEAMAELLKELKADMKSVKAEGKLVKAYKKGGTQFGVLQFTVGFKTAGKELADGKGDMVLTADVPIDGSSTLGELRLKVNLVGKQMVEQDGMKFVVDIAVNLDGKEMRTAGE